MATTQEEMEGRRRRWNAAALQRCLRQRSRHGAHPSPEDLPLVAGDLQEELRGEAQQSLLLQAAWVDLMRKGLLVFDALGPGGLHWRLADSPATPGWLVPGRYGEGRA
jgi:hypothetical protein